MRQCRQNEVSPLLQVCLFSCLPVVYYLGNGNVRMPSVYFHFVVNIKQQTACTSSLLGLVLKNQQVMNRNRIFQVLDIQLIDYDLNWNTTTTVADPEIRRGETLRKGARGSNPRNTENFKQFCLIISLILVLIIWAKNVHKHNHTQCIYNIDR